MKKIIIVLSTFLLLVLPVSAKAAKVSADRQSYRLDSAGVVEDDLIVLSQNTDIRGTIKGDLIVLSGNASIKGVVEGDLIAFSGQIQIEGEIKDDVRVAGGTVEVDGKVGDDLFVASGDLSINQGAKILGDVWAGSSNLEINGETGNIKSGVSKFIIGEEAKIDGDIEFWSDNDVDIKDGASYSGELTKNSIDKKYYNNNFYRFSSVATLIIMLLFLTILMPKKSQEIGDLWSKKFSLNVIYGLAFILLTPLLAIVLLVTMFLAPIGLMMLALYPVVFYLGVLFGITGFGLWLKEVISPSTKFYLPLVVALSAILYSLVSLIPIYGGILNFIIISAGVGAFFSEILRFINLRRKEARL